MYISIFNLDKLNISHIVNRVVPFLLILILFSCSGSDNKAVFYQKPKGFAQLDLPDHQYQPIQDNLPYSFEISKYAELRPDESLEAEPYWVIVNYPELDAIIQFTYKPLKGDLKKLDEHVMDAYKLASKHQIKAIAQTEHIVELNNGRKAVTIEIEGEVPSHFQFYSTDTSQHYLRGAVYLKEATLNDSLKPIVDYLKVDARHILETLKWKN